MSWRGYDSGYERAREHIEAARRLRAELGDAEAQTRATFLNLDRQRLDRLLHAYRVRYGGSAYDYCLQALPKWRSGRRKMSGMVAERIFNLLPRFVTTDERQEIAEKLWRHLSPGSSERLVLSPESDPAEVRAALDDYANRNIRDWQFSGQMRARFAWIANDDIELTQVLLNYFQQAEYKVAAEAIRIPLPIIAEKLDGLSDGLTATAAEEIRVGKHRLRIVFSTSAAEDVDPGARAAQQLEAPWWSIDSNIGCLGWLIVGAIILWLLSQA